LKKFHPFYLAALSAILLSAAWPVSPLTSLIFIAWTPLFWLEQQGISRRRFFGWVYLTMVIWNTATTWWIWNASAPGAIGAILANSLLMCLPWLGFHFVKKRAGDRMGYLSIIAFWLSFEYIHLQNWGLSWPWLTVGNVFASHPQWVQWYEYTGTSGGSFWVLSVNVLVFLLLRKKFQQATFKTLYAWLLLAALFLPLLLSLYQQHSAWRSDPVPGPGDNIVIVQPNIDPYEKIETGSFDAQLHQLLRLSESAIDSHTVLVVWPETALSQEIEEDHMKSNFFLNPLWYFLRSHPQINLLTGVESLRMYKGPQTPTARRIPESDTWYDGYNTAMMLDSSGPIGIYHKSRLVPGVETLPPFLKFIDSWFEKFGGTTSGYVGQPDRTVLQTSNHSYHVAPAICYESIYGEFISAYVRNGADIIAIITNDGWWGNTPGYRQHESYARLRAIETRRWIVRSANTGISCLISPAGEVLDPQPWDVATTMKVAVPANKRLTFYVQYGDLLSRLAMLTAIFVMVWVAVVRTKRKQ
jgi:apolipoprotein N-acyltransferase